MKRSISVPSLPLRAFLGLFLVTCVLMLSGCGNGQKSVTKVSGKVTFDGKPVTGGVITFAPIGSADAGKPASGSVKSDGTFTLTTYTDGDGVVPGKHSVTFTPPAPEVKERPDGHSVTVPGAFDDLRPVQAEVEVKEGNGEVTIELSKGS